MTVGADQVPSVRVLTHWDAGRLETTAVTPRGAAAVVILWEHFADVDGGVPDRLARPLARALTTLGEVCFRIADAPPANARVLGRVKASGLPFARLWPVVGTRDPAAVLSLFELGWAQGDQVATVAPPDDARAMAMLGTKRIDGIALAGEELVVAAIVDGTGMLVAAAHRDRLDNATGLMMREFADAGAQARG